MGLDMYLNKYPRYKNVTVDQIDTIESYFDWVDYKTQKGYDGSFEKWCRRSLEDLPSIEVIEFFRQFYKKRYSVWDVEQKYGYMQIHEQAAYWRKANQIHAWFVEHVQDGEDDCNYHREVTKGDLEELIDICHEVLCNPDLASLRLPTRGGFFFGDTVYDEYYIKDIEKTIDMLTKVLETTDFDKEMLYYVSSW